ncbi:type II toxin-antitoxin system VapC family toxin [Calidifontibacter sp. DB0510]|uniref:Ribonuclease VapC n=1 Tax=Metallococcus carri TaxID=1656884 RepID=A0A967B0Q2_9MICO|nr:type II toxin-antitoxin system VapC family toxin [Metallococcus carri]NHN55105.1 type II toxin-antitoxin system VapC family toxin [Metallococcus carri]NOP36182.1 type II toxin-antitoxin system VapC family toxin [Calidifontibacter sp. DB2511S]
MIVLDTNVISEVFRPRPSPAVVDWLQSLTGEVAITAITLAELQAGLEALPAGRRSRALRAQVSAALEPYLNDGSVLPFDAAAAPHYAGILTARQSAGLPISTADAQIAAICRAHGATLATRNVKDFVEAGVEVVDPWTA